MVCRCSWDITDLDILVKSAVYSGARFWIFSMRTVLIVNHFIANALFSGMNMQITDQGQCCLKSATWLL